MTIRLPKLRLPTGERLSVEDAAPWSALPAAECVSAAMAALSAAGNPACTDVGLGVMGGYVIAVVGTPPLFCDATVLIAPHAGEDCYAWRPALPHEDAIMKAASLAELRVRGLA